MLILIRIYLTYIKTNYQTGEKYIGITSMLVEDDSLESAEKALNRREKAPHHKNKEGFLRGIIDKISTNRNAIRGREQLLYEKFKKEGIITAQNQPVSNRNPKKSLYIQAAIETFGEILMCIYFLNH